MKITKIIALSLAAVALLSMASCKKKGYCEICHVVPSTHFESEEIESDMCDYCYQRIVKRETDSDAAAIRKTDFEALTDEQKNYIVIYFEERAAFYNAVLQVEHSHATEDEAYKEAAQKYSKTEEQIKSLVEAHAQRGSAD